MTVHSGLGVQDVVLLAPTVEQRKSFVLRVPATHTTWLSVQLHKNSLSTEVHIELSCIGLGAVLCNGSWVTMGHTSRL